jgi:hypothetical protein
MIVSLGKLSIDMIQVILDELVKKGVNEVLMTLLWLVG